MPVSTFRDNNYWQDEQTKVFIKKKMKAFRAYQENPTGDTKQAFKASRMKLGNRIRKFKRDRYRKALDELTNCSDLSKRLKGLEERHEINILSSDGEACSPEESVRNLMDKHCPGSLPEKEELPPRFMKSKVSIENETEFITYSYVKRAIQEFGKHKAAGPDGLKPIILQNLPKSTLEAITMLMKAV